MSYLEHEIYEQADGIRRFVREELETVHEIAIAIKNFAPTYVLIAARGTSDNAARYAQYLMGVFLGLPVALGAPSIHTLYGAKPDMSKALVIGISQSGASLDIRQIVKDAREQGAMTLGITNNEESPLAHEAEHHIFLHCGEEKSVAATKSYTAQLSAIALLTLEIAENEAMRAEFNRLPEWVESTLAASSDVGRWVERYRYVERIAVIGRGFNYCSAFEIALKVKELCYIVGEEYSEADFRHGPIAIISPGFPVMVVAPSGKPLPLLVDLLQKLQEREAECIVVSDDEAACAYGKNSVKLPVGIPEWLSPICAVIPGQLFAYHLAQAKGHNIDQPRGLSKVTVTR